MGNTAGAVSIAPEIADYHWLIEPQGERWLREAEQLALPLHRLAEMLRRDLSAARTHLALEQIELRQRAAVKFRAAGRMFFTRLGLEQSTDQWVAAYKASRFPSGAPLADLCCGIGGDLLAMAACGPTLGLDRQPIAALLAEANLRMLAEEWKGGAVPTATIRCSDVGELARSGELAEFSAWHIDPDRRPHGRRTTRVELHEPNAERLEAWRAVQPHASFKLAPAAQLPEAWPGEAELEWISRDGECKQLVAWFGNLTSISGQRRATMVLPDGRSHSILGQEAAGRKTPRPPLATTLGRYLFEPDAAVLAAHLSGTLAALHGLTSVAEGSVYLTGDAPLDEPALTTFAVMDVLPLQTRQLKQYLRERNIGRLEIKTRGVAHEPDQLRKTLQVPGDERATLICTPVPNGVGAIVAERIGKA